MKESKIDLVLQGPYTNFTDEIISSYLELPFVSNIIVSCWEADKKDEYQSERVLFVRNPTYSQYSGVMNINLQLITSLSGVKKSNAKFVGKMRSDQKFNHLGMVNMFDFFMNNIQKNQIMICGNYFAFLFHPRDHVFWGYKDDMINLFDIPFEVNETCEKLGVNRNNAHAYMNLLTRPETYIGAYYCSRFDDRVKKMVENQKEYLFDNAPRWDEALSVSKEVMLKAFKSFPREGVDFIWPKNNIYCLPYDPNYEGWHEEGY